jgi:4-alpha-glucanotransferase
MILTFRVRFHTQYGQSLLLTGEHPLLGDGDVAKALPLSYLDDKFWQVTVGFPHAPGSRETIAYNYLLRQSDGSLTYDWGKDRIITPSLLDANEILVLDSWNFAGFFENAFYTEPFQKVLLKQNLTEARNPTPARVTHIFKAKAPLLAKDQTLCLLGNTTVFGNWRTEKPVLLDRVPGQNYLSASVDLSNANFPIAYKYGVYDTQRHLFLRFEDGDNRGLRGQPGSNKPTLLHDGFARLPSNTWKGAGVSIPVFSLRSEASFGVGEFTDLKPLADWCQRAGLKLIQILPVNDTIATHTWLDSYPYSAISAFALHPIYLNLRRVVSAANQPLLAEMEPERKRLNALDALDYPVVMKAKMTVLRRIFPSQKKETLRNPEFRRFLDENQHWLTPYAVFCCLRDQYGTVDFSQWPEHRRCSPEVIAKFAGEEADSFDQVAFYYFVQFHLDLQLREASEHAHARGVILKGDIPIGVYRHGADAWQEPELYRMEMQAGAPPDAFGIKGQNWSFPIYNWPRMKQDQFAWWRRRFEQMGRYFDAFRMDHILGFFRIWSIPMHAVEGILGYFVPAIPVHINEISARGIWFDRLRYTQPYITDKVLWEVFGPIADEVKNFFLIPLGLGNYALKPEFATQRQVERHFAALDPSAYHAKLKQGLFDLIANVILIQAEGSPGQQFHFRFAIETTSSFKALDARTQGLLRDLYIDYFFRRQEDLWRQEALEKLPALKRVTNMLVCGEDLGLVPACVPEVMRDLGLLSLEVQRMPKVMNQEFFRPREAPYLSVVTPSTHDMSTIRGWWEEDANVRQRFFNHELGRPGIAPDRCEAWINQAIVDQHLSSPAMWSILQLQDLLGADENLRRPNPQDERINVPADPNNCWRYRMHLTIEALLKAAGFNERIREAVAQAGR